MRGLSRVSAATATVERELPGRLGVPAPPEVLDRPFVSCKFFHQGREKLLLRGVTYGTFRPDAEGNEYPPLHQVERDFAQMSAAGIGCVRTYTVPQAAVLDAASRHGLYLLVGLAAERHVGHLNRRGGDRAIEIEIRAGVAVCAGHSAVLGYAIGNEIPAGIVRWFGPKRTERLLGRLTAAVRDEDPDALVTYANYPSTEYLDLPFLDFVSFNVFLEDPQRLTAYLGRLQNIAGDRPLVMTELGLDAVRNGDRAQARSVAAQVRAAIDGGCAGAFVYSWTDEWHRGGEDVQDWEFGLTTRDRSPKPALATATTALAAGPFASRRAWPRVSVVVCTHNGSATLRDCLDGVTQLDYPDYETIVVADGCTDASADIAAEYPVRVLAVEPIGLSEARNLGMIEATGDIVAYLDDDARPDPDWLRHAAAALTAGGHAGVGGPNIGPPHAPPVAQCVDNAPGGPTHVLLSDSVAEHIPGCNMAFWRSRLAAIGGFDGQFRAAGDDVDVCWRLQDRGWTLGYVPAAVVLHHRRSSVRAFIRQQLTYGRAEAALERKWPDKHNGGGHLLWRGRLYTKSQPDRTAGLGRDRVEYGVWGAGLFQRLYTPAAGPLTALARSPEWYLVILALALLSALGTAWAPLLWLAPLCAAAALVPLADAVRGGAGAQFAARPRSRWSLLRMRALTAFLHLGGPAARLSGRLVGGLTPWRLHRRALALPRPRRIAYWSESRREALDRVGDVESALRATDAPSRRGGPHDRWDLEVRGGTLGAARVLLAIEEHGGGAQLVRAQLRPRWSHTAVGLAAVLATLGALAVGDGAPVAAAALLAAATATTVAIVLQVAAACGAARTAIAHALGTAQRLDGRR